MSSSDEDMPLVSLLSSGKVKKKEIESSDEDVPLTDLKPKIKKSPGRPKKVVKKEVDSDSDEDLPLTKVAIKKKMTPAKKEVLSESEDSEDIPLSKAAIKKKPAAKKAAAKKKKPAAKKKKQESSSSESSSESESDSSDEDKPLVSKKKAATKKKVKAKDSKKRKAEDSKKKPPAKKVKKEEKIVPDPPEYMWWREEKLPDGQKWRTLEHHGVLFPPEYAPHNVKMLYDGKPVTLTPAQEEVATFYAVMLETDYVKTNKTFNKNFFKDWKTYLGKDHVIQKLEKCNFRPIYDHCMREREAKKNASPEEKKKMKEERLKIEEKYGTAIVDGHPQKVGNFRVEPPGLFRGRGEHPKAGTVKKRVYPEDVVINIGKTSGMPPCPMAGHKWGGHITNNKVTWLAFWKDTVNDDFKYVWLAANSRFRGESDLNKFEKARKLKKHVEKIRTAYTKALSSKDMRERQMATCLYFIDKLALRVGNEKDEDNEADTVGCCSLRKEHIALEEKMEDGKKVHYVTFDFLGKDSIQYLNTVEVLDTVYHNLEKFMKGKSMTEELFEQVQTSALNNHLKDYMDGLTAKVFRTYNASITLDNELQKTPEKATIQDKIVEYNRANREVAILCNHQKSVSKGHAAAMEKVGDRLEDMKKEKKALKKALESSKKGGKPVTFTDREGKEKNLPDKPDKIKAAIARLDGRIATVEMQQQTKEDNKSVALNTSKINYNDPRITVAWCRKHQVPLAKVFNKSLVEKFPWALDVTDEWRF